MATIIVRNSGGRPATVEATCSDTDPDTRVIWSAKSAVGLAVKFKCQGRWFYQSLHWSCRGGKRSYYPALVLLYRTLRKMNLVPAKSLRHLADGGAILELRLDGAVIKRGSDTEIERIYSHVSNREYSKDDQHFQERREALSKALNVSRWIGVLEVFRLRSAYNNAPSKSAWLSTVLA